MEIKLIRQDDEYDEKKIIWIICIITFELNQLCESKIYFHLIYSISLFKHYCISDD
jgi:hypothetical protein